MTVVEWGEGLVEGLSEERLEIHLDRTADDEARTVAARRRSQMGGRESGRHAVRSGEE